MRITLLLLMSPLPSKVNKDLKVERNVRERDHYLNEFRCPTKEKKCPKDGKIDSKIQENTYILTKGMKGNGKPRQLNQELQVAKQHNGKGTKIAQIKFCM